jgi:hypothetical protein
MANKRVMNQFWIFNSARLLNCFPRTKNLLIKIWFECTNYVLSNLDHHSSASIDYLRKNSATQYTLQEFKNALSYEYIPRSTEEAEREIVYCLV